MSFSEANKLIVKKRADFTCCWCTDHRNKVDVHHIIPEAAGGPDSLDNAAPLCGACHALFGANPDLRKEIRFRRDHWYLTCDARRSFHWPVSSRQPVMNACHRYEPRLAKSAHGTDLRYGNVGIQLFSEDSAVDIIVNAAKVHGVRAIAFAFRFPFGLGFVVGIHQIDTWTAEGFIKTLRGVNDLWLMRSADSEIGELSDNVMLVRESTGEIFMAISTYSPSGTAFGLSARLTEEVSQQLAAHLEHVGFG